MKSSPRTPHCSWIVLCMLLVGCGKVPPNSMADAIVLCKGFGGLAEVGFYKAETTLYTRRVTVDAKCKDGSDVWRTTEERL